MAASNIKAECLQEIAAPTIKDDLKTWLLAQAEQHQLEYLLVHALDGVIWGKFQDGKLLLSSDAKFPLQPGLAPEAVSPTLRESTLMQCTAFGKKAELRIWREETGITACVLSDPAEAGQMIEDEAWLWGNPDEQDGEFVLMREGEQDLLHAIPYPDAPEKSRMALVVHHIIDYDPQGRAYIAFSRLAGIKLAEKGGAQ